MDKSSAVRVDLPILDVKIMGKSTRPAVEPSPEPKQEVPASVSEVKVEKSVSEIKVSAVKIDKPVLAIKKLRTIGSMGAPDPGDQPKDGDGDGLIYDNTPRERPAPINFPGSINFPGFVPEQLSETWSKIHQDGLDRRREAARKRGLASGPRPNVREIRDALQNYDIDFIDAVARQMFEHEGLGRDGTYRSEVTDVSTENSDAGYQRIVVEGLIYDDSGEEVGYFIRNIEPFGDDENEEPAIYHEELDMKSGSEDARGLGIGSSFTLASELEYAAHGFGRIHLTAALADGPRVWARDDYDWQTPDDRQNFLLGILRQINANPNKYFSGPLPLRLIERKAYRKMIEEALNEDFDDPDRLRPVHFALSPAFKDIMNDARKGSGVRYRAQRQVRNYSIPNRESNIQDVDQVISTGAGTPDKYESVKSVRNGDISKPAARPLVVDPEIAQQQERQLLKDLFSDAGIQLDVDELDRTNGWAAAWEQYGEALLDVVSIKGDFKAVAGSRTLNGRTSAEELMKTFRGRWLEQAEYYKQLTPRDIEQAKQNRLKDKKYQAELLDFAALADRLKNANPEDRDGEIRAIVARSLMDHVASIRDNIRRHPEFEGRIAINGPRPNSPINIGASVIVMPVQRVDDSPISVGYGLSLGSTVGVPRVLAESGILDGNDGIDPGTAVGTIAHEFGHALDTEASLVRAGINPRTDDLIGDIAKDYPQLQDSILGVIYSLQTPQITDPATKISDIPRGSINAAPVSLMARAAASLNPGENTQTSMANTLLALITPTVKLRPVRIPGENITDTEPSIYDMAFSPEFAMILSDPAGFGAPSKSVNEEVAKRALKPVPDLKNYAKGLSERLQTLLHEATDGLGIYMQSRGDSYDELLKRTRGLTMYANTAPHEFLAEAHAMIDMLENNPAMKANPAHAAMIQKVRTLYEYMLDTQNRDIDLRVPDAVKKRLAAAVIEANALARDLQKDLGITVG